MPAALFVPALAAKHDGNKLRRRTVVPLCLCGR